MFDLVPGAASSAPSGLTALSASLLLFAAFTPATGRELFKFDASTGLVTLVADLEAGVDDSTPTSFKACNGRVFFRANDKLLGTDGSSVDDLGLTSSTAEPGRGICVGTQLLFPDGSTLRKSDGAAAGTSAVATFTAKEFAVLGARVFMHDGDQLVSIGTDLVGPPLLLKEIRAGVSDQIQTLSTFGAPPRLFFAANDGISGREPYVSDGTEVGTVQLADLIGGTASSMTTVPPVVVGSTVYFIAAGQLFKSVNGGTPASLFMSPQPPAVLAVAGTKVILRESSTTDTVRAFDDATGMVTLCDAPTVNTPTLSAAAGRVYFVARSPTTGLEEIWVTDGTAGCTQLKDLLAVSSSTSSSSPTRFAAIGNTVFFHALSNATGRELYRTTSPFESVELVKDIRVGSDDGIKIVQPLVVMGSRVFFAADDGTNGV
ncbi:MAG: hypothetical protein IV100_30975, partial [Myxococcales bacterium]|nr:hypothetical protein [Myxococcales bacterium]